MKLGTLVECKQQDLAELVTCLRNTPMFQLMNTHPNFYSWKHLQQVQQPGQPSPPLRPVYTVHFHTSVLLYTPLHLYTSVHVCVECRVYTRLLPS